MDLLGGSSERISAVSVTGAKASRRICVSASLYRIVRGQDFRGRFQASATRLSSIATTLWYNGFQHRCGRPKFHSRQILDGFIDRCRQTPSNTAVFKPLRYVVPHFFRACQNHRSGITHCLAPESKGLNYRFADHSKVGQTSQYKSVNQEFCAVRIGAGGTTISTSPVATS